MTSPLDHLLGAYGLAPALDPTPQSTSFTVVVRTQGRRPKSLNEALDALDAQSFTDFDVVVVVHGPNEEVERVRERVGDRMARRLRLVAVQGGGRATPLNTGLDHVTGSHICFLDDDDLVHENWLSAFAEAITVTPDRIIRAVTQSQAWTSEGGAEPVRAVGEVERPFPDRFDLLAHTSLNLTPICSLAYPRTVIDRLGLRFCDDLAVYEDWDFLMRAAMIIGVASIPDETSLYRRLDSGNADTAESLATWERAHAMVIDRLSAQPVLLPTGDARRLAGTHFVTGGRSRHEADLAVAEATIDQLTRSPIRWLRAWTTRVAGAVRRRTSRQQP
jgi:glycosyltransferase involved in cell wall biosynthesis